MILSPSHVSFLCRSFLRIIIASVAYTPDGPAPLFYILKDRIGGSRYFESGTLVWVGQLQATGATNTNELMIRGARFSYKTVISKPCLPKQETHKQRQ